MKLDDFIEEKRLEIKAASSCKWYELAIEELITEAYMAGYEAAAETAIRAVKEGA